MLMSREVDQAAFKAALGSLATTVNVITMWDESSRPLGMTATAFASVSAEPPQVLVCVNRTARTYQCIAERGSFGVNVLGSAARDISDHCARPGADKALDRAWLTRPHATWQNPALAGAVAFLDCRIVQDVHAGSHAVLIGAVEGIGLSEYAHDHEPLVYFQGGYRSLSTAPSAARSVVSLPILVD